MSAQIVKDIIDQINNKSPNKLYSYTLPIKSVSNITEIFTGKKINKKEFPSLTSLIARLTYINSIIQPIIVHVDSEPSFRPNPKNSNDFVNMLKDDVIERLLLKTDNTKDFDIVYFTHRTITINSTIANIILKIGEDYMIITRFDNGIGLNLKNPDLFKSILSKSFDILKNIKNAKLESYLFGEDQLNINKITLLMGTPISDATEYNMLYRSRISENLFKEKNKEDKARWIYKDTTDQEWKQLYEKEPSTFFKNYQLPLFVNAEGLFISEGSNITGDIKPSIQVNIIRPSNLASLDDILNALNGINKTYETKKIKNCLVRQLLQAYKPEGNDLKEKKFDNLLSFVEKNNIIAVDVQKHLQDFAMKLNITIELYTKFGFQYSNEPILIIKSKNRKEDKRAGNTIIKLLIEDKHCRRYIDKFCFTSDYVQYINTQEEFNNNIYNDNAIFVNYEKNYTVNIDDGQTFIYKQFKPYEYLYSPVFDVCYNENRCSQKLLNNYNKINNIYYKKFHNVHTKEALAFAILKDINHIKNTTSFRKEYKYSCFPIARHTFANPKNTTYTEIDQNSAYLSIKQAKNYKGFPKNNSRLLDITKEYLESEDTFKNVSLIHIEIKGKKTNQTIIDNIIIKNSSNLWIPFNLYTLIDKHYYITPTHAILDDFTDILLSELTQIFPHLYDTKNAILEAIGKLIFNGIKITNDKEIINPKKKISDLSKKDFEIIEYEINQKNIPYTVKRKMINNKEYYDISFETKQPKIRQYVHINTFIYGYSAEIFLNKMLDLNIPYIKINLTQSDNKITLNHNIITPNIKLLGIKTDCICIENDYNPEILQYKFKMNENENLKILGEFKHPVKKDSAIFNKLMPKQNQFKSKSVPIPQSSELFLNTPHQKIFSIITSPGTGKTLNTLKQIPDELGLILTPTNSRKASLMEELKQMNKIIDVKTIHDYLDLQLPRPYSEVKGFKNVNPKEYFYQSQKTKKNKYYSHIVVDEYTLTNKKLLEAILQTKFQYLFILGDDKQCSNPTRHLGKIHKYDLPGFIIDKCTRNDNMRQNIKYGEFLDQLRELKNPLDIIREFQKKYKAKTLRTPEELTQYFDNSKFLGSCHENNAEINKHYLNYKKSRKEPIKIKADKIYTETMDYTTPIKKSMNDNLKKYIAYAISINSCQGMTLNQNIIIDLKNLGNETNKIYTALTRSRTPNQIIFYL